MQGYGGHVRVRRAIALSALIIIVFCVIKTLKFVMLIPVESTPLLSRRIPMRRLHQAPLRRPDKVSIKAKPLSDSCNVSTGRSVNWYDESG
jgi:hypothetical protein